MQERRLAIIEIRCPHCDEPTRATIPDDTQIRGEHPQITCEKCGETFEFTDGLLYRPIRYAN